MCTPEKEENADPSFSIGDVVCGYTIKEKIDEGGFGQVFRVADSVGKNHAMKIEYNSLEGGSAIKLEIDVFTQLKKENPPYFPKMIAAGRKAKFHFLVMELLGDNLKTLRYKSPKPDQISIGTWTRIGIQCLYVIKTLHENCFLHRDIKPSNFAFGYGDDVWKNRMVYLFDFGIARRFILKATAPEETKPVGDDSSEARTKTEKGKGTEADGRSARKIIHSRIQKQKKSTKEFKEKSSETKFFKFRIARPTVDFRGTQLYASPNSHDHKELGRADDVWSLMYMLAELTHPLPWSFVNEDDVKVVKEQSRLEKLFGIPEFQQVDDNLRSCEYYDWPDYEMIFQILRNIMIQKDVKWSDPYDWESSESPDYKAWKKFREDEKKKYPWEDPVDPENFFQKDAWAKLSKPKIGAALEAPNKNTVELNSDKKKKGNKQKENSIRGQTPGDSEKKKDRGSKKK